LTAAIGTYSSYTLSNNNINTIVNDFNPASMIPSTDPLYIRIESEELNEADGDRQNTTVRQMFINVNVDNTKATTTTQKFSQSDDYTEVTLGSASGTKYLAKVSSSTNKPSTLVYVNGSSTYTSGWGWYSTTYYYTIEDGPYTDYTVGSGGNYYVTETVTPRPMIIFYEGPDRGLTEGVDDSDKNSSQSGSPKEAYPNLSWRDSKPVILNLNADFRGILFAPNSPVVINGNGKNFHGFVVAREFVRVTTEKDYTVKNGKYIDANGKEWFKSSQTNNGIMNTVFVDEYGNVDTRPLDNATRALGSAETLAGIPAEDEIVAYRARHLDMELVYKMSAFNLGSDSYYDSFNVPELKRNVYTYLDNYQDSDKANSVDMFFTTIRSKWIT